MWKKEKIKKKEYTDQRTPRKGLREFLEKKKKEKREEEEKELRSIKNENEIWKLLIGKER